MAKHSFYDVKKRAKVEVEEKDVMKKVYVRETSKGKQERYALRAKVGGTNLTKFVSKAVFDKVSAPMEK